MKKDDASLVFVAHRIMEEQRAHRRYPLRCRIALRGNDQQLIYGETLDISSGGASVLVAHNIAKGTLFSLYLQLPARRVGATPDVVEARARVMYGAFSTGHDRWRLGIQFLDFGGKPLQMLEAEFQRYG